jgi:hypothetical protein
MRIYTSHVRPGETPVLVREGFSWAGFFFGVLYLAAHRAWVAAALNLAALILLAAICRFLGSPAPLLGLAILQGLFARDLCRWGLARRGYATGPVIAASDLDQAFARLLGARPDLLPPDFLPPDFLPRVAGAL